MAESQKERLMKKLHISAKEAEEILAYDKAVDKGEKTEYDLSADKEKEVRKYRQADRKPTAYKFSKRERKPNDLKRALVAAIAEFLPTAGLEVKNLQVTNIERQIAFSIENKDFELTLVQKRAKKDS